MSKAITQKFYRKLVKVGLAFIGFFFIWTIVVFNNMDGSEHKIEIQVDELEVLLPLHWKNASLFINDLPNTFASQANKSADALLAIQSLSIKEAIKTQTGCDIFSHAMQNYQQEITLLLNDIKIQVRTKKIPMPRKEWFEFAKESTDVATKLQMLGLLIENYNDWINGESAQYINYIFYNRKEKPLLHLNLTTSGFESLERHGDAALHP